MSASLAVDDLHTPPAPFRASAEDATQRLNRLLAEFRLYGGFGGRDGMRLWGDIQRAVREIERLKATS